MTTKVNKKNILVVLLAIQITIDFFKLSRCQCNVNLNAKKSILNNNNNYVNNNRNSSIFKNDYRINFPNGVYENQELFNATEILNDLLYKYNRDQRPGHF